MPRHPTRPILALVLAALLAPSPVLAEDADAGAYLAARIAGGTSDYTAAAGWYTRALLADPGDPSLLEAAIVANLGLGEFDTATTIAARLHEIDALNQVAAIALLVDQVKVGDFAGVLAEAKAGRSIGALADDLVAAWAEQGMGQMSEALARFDKVATTPGLEVIGLYHKALALALVGDFEGADSILSGRAAGPLRGTRSSVIAHAQILSQLERNPDALELLGKTFSPGQDPGIDALRKRLAAGEVVPFDGVRSATDGLAEVFFTLGSAMQGDPANTLTLIYARIAATLRPDHTAALLLAAGLLDDQGQHDLASGVYGEILTSDPMFYVAEIGRADSLYADGKPDAAIAVLQALTSSDGQKVAVQAALADALRREERYDEASRAYDAAIALVGKPERRHWTLFYSRGVCHERLKHWPRAEADFRRALELSPDQPQVLNYLGYSFLEMNLNLDEALAMIERAAKAQPDNGAIIDSLAWALYRLGRYGDALEPMERASVLEPVDPVVTDHLGDVYWAVGRKLEARFQWRRALSFDPVEADAPRIRSKLEVGLDAVLAGEGGKPLPTQAADGN